MKEDRRTLATRRRDEARTGKPKLVQSMLQSVKGTPAEAKYVLFDSWFASPSAILSTAGLGYHVVARLKNHERYLYAYQGENLPISKIYRAINDTPRATDFAAELNSGETAKKQKPL